MGRGGPLALHGRCPPSGPCGAVTYALRSRRRGRSIGINLFPLAQVCSFNCVYCFRGPTRILTAEPRDDGSGIDGRLLLEALEAAHEATGGMEGVESLDFSGNGEPTLHPRFPELVEVARSFLRERGLDASLGVFTNSSTLGAEPVIGALGRVDYVEAKLDAASREKFLAINAPHGALSLDRIIGGLGELRRRFGGTLAIQVMLLRHRGLVNYGMEDAGAMAEALSRVGPDEVHLYTVYRAPRLPDVERAPRDAMEEFAEVLAGHGLNVKVYSDRSGEAPHPRRPPAAAGSRAAAPGRPGEARAPPFSAATHSLTLIRTSAPATKDMESAARIAVAWPLSGYTRYRVAGTRLNRIPSIRKLEAIIANRAQ